MHTDRLRREVEILREEVAAWGAATFRHWRRRIGRRSFAPAALNLAHYLALRRHELRHLQAALMPLGLSSLGRAEGRVLASLDAVRATLAALSSNPGALRPPTARQFRRGERLLSKAARELFGASQTDRTGRILVTLGTDAARDPQVLRRIVEGGADAVRINCAHDDADRWAAMLENLRDAERRSGRHIRVLMDMAGPKVRTADIATGDQDRVRAGDEILIRRAGALPNPVVAFQVGCTLPAALDRLKIGDPLALDDGKVRGTITREHDGNLVGQVTTAPLKGYRLKPNKGLNFPGIDLKLDPLTARDLVDLDFIAAHADLVGLSFVSTSEHVARLQHELDRRSPNRLLGIVLKIETRRAAQNLPDLIVQSAGRQPTGVMIARGDLAVELGFEELALAQEEMLWLCEAASVPVIWATQVLEGLVKKGVPSRGEMTDAAMAGRAECVMLNKGPNLLAGIEALDAMMRHMAQHQTKKTPTLARLDAWDEGELGRAS